MERELNNFMMEQSRTYNHLRYNPNECGNEELQPASQGLRSDPTSDINANLRPPDFNISEVKPVHNYSIQTGEEFALEFMRDRVYPKLIPNPAGDPNFATGYMDLKGILGISHTGSESGSEISMLTVVEKGPKEFERKNSSLYDVKSNYGSVQSVPRTSSGYDSSRVGYTSSGASDNSTTKMKILCSFGGKILPRPSDGKLRYVGGETRIIRIRKDISWQQLMQKTLTIYNQAKTIKYQLPGEDLDALVSVSCDEDLQNMIEECNELVDGEGSKKLRMFLFSAGDLDDAHNSLTSMDGDSEIQYVVAVNGMDMGLRKNSTSQGLASSSANNLYELNGQNVETETKRVATDSVGVSSSPLTGIIAPSLTNQSSQPILPSSSSAYETHSQLYHGQMMHLGDSMQHQLDYGYYHNPSNFSPFGVTSVAMPLDGLRTQQGVLTEGKPYDSLLVQSPEMLVKEMKLKSDGPFQQKSDPGKILPSETDHLAPSQPYDSNIINHSPVEEASVAIPASEGKHQQQPAQVSSPLVADNLSQVPKSNDNDYHQTSSNAFAPGYTDSDSDPIDLSYLGPPVPQRVFYSERMPRGQAELLSRLSKSDDSLGPQLLMAHAHSNTGKPDSIIESVDQLNNGNLASETEHSISTGKPLQTDPQTIDDGLAQLEKYKMFADAIGQTNPNLSEGILESESRQTVPRFLDTKDGTNEDRVLKVERDETSEAGSVYPMVTPVSTEKHQEDPASSLPELNWGDMAGEFITNKNTQANAQPFDWMESSTKGVFQGEKSVGVSTPEHGDILIDINDRFPRDFLSDIFSKAVLSDDPSGIIPLHKDGVGSSVNMANYEPKRWSYFQKFAQDEFVQKDVSLIDQDHLVFSPALAKVEEEAPISYPSKPLMKDGIAVSQVESQISFAEDTPKKKSDTVGTDTSILHSNYNPSQVLANEGIHFDGKMENLRTPDSEYEDGKMETRNIGLPPQDPSLGDIDISSLQIIKNADLEELRELGSGTFGTVYHGKWRGTDVAIKRIKKSCFTGRSSEQERLTIEFWREAVILSKLQHPNVVAFYGVVQDGPGGTLATVAEFMVDGSLRSVLLRKDRHLDRRKRLIIAMDAAFGMEYLHSKNIVHFDLKCDNLLVNLKDPLRPICKVGDFGLSKIKRNTLVSGGVRGTLPWMAPELLNGSSNKVSEKVDVFSFGIVLWEILTGEEPYANMHYGAIIGGIVNNTLRPTIPGYCDGDWRELMECCWAPNPVVRPSFTEIASRLRAMTAACPTKAHAHKASK